MELGVEFDVAGRGRWIRPARSGVHALSKLPLARHQHSQVSDLLIGDPISSASDRPGLERLPKFVMLHDLAQIQLAHPHAALRKDLHEAIASKSLHRDANRRLAHPQSGDQLALGDERSRGQLSTQ